MYIYNPISASLALAGPKNAWTRFYWPLGKHAHWLVLLAEY